MIGKRILQGAVALAMVAAATAPASATVLEWTLSGTYDDGSTVGGTFLFDTDTSTFSDINIGYNGGPNYPATVFNVA